MGATLEVQGLAVARSGGDSVLESVSFSLPPGEVLAVVGASGGGKSTLLRALVGLLPEGWTCEGAARLGDVQLVGRAADAWAELRGRRIGFVFQEPQRALLPTRRVVDQVGLAFRGRPKAARRAQACAALERVGFADAATRGRAFPHELSGGERQRVLLAMALAQSPELILADEPTAHLDPVHQAHALDVLRAEVRERGASLLLVGHDLGLVAQIADRVLVLRGGQIVESGSMKDILHNPGHPYTHELLAAVPRPPKDPTP